MPCCSCWRSGRRKGGTLKPNERGRGDDVFGRTRVFSCHDGSLRPWHPGLNRRNDETFGGFSRLTGSGLTTPKDPPFRYRQKAAFPPADALDRSVDVAAANSKGDLSPQFLGRCGYEKKGQCGTGRETPEEDPSCGGVLCGLADRMRRRAGSRRYACGRFPVSTPR